MTDEECLRKFDCLMEQLHDSGWNVLAVMVKTHPDGEEVSQRTMLHGKDEDEKARAFFRCNRAFRDQLGTASDALNPRWSGYEEVAS